ncbi:unnamed protein product [Enterobius vermicularis]|uniref:GATOR complex protein NPRL3 n=1 Tax=Enterobius vermicularis TaxID=51028 RepID=A0A0N4VFF9_ENTVE|nr:unnamed protein product [Enterobius vermicularis]
MLNASKIRMDDEKYLYVPLSLLFVTLSENHEQISFAYPFQSSKAVNCGNILQIDCSSLQKPISNFYALRDEKNKGYFIISGLNPDTCFLRVLEDPLRCEAINRLDSISPLEPEILAHLLSGKGATDLPFELKIDNLRYVGYPKMVTVPRERAPRIFNVVFVVSVNMPADLVTSYEELSQKIAVAIDSEQTRCNYLNTHMSIMLDAHDTLDRLQSSDSSHSRNYEAECFHEILLNSTLAADLCNIFIDISDHGLVSVFLNKVVEIGFCLMERCMVQAGLAPKTSKQIEAQIRWIRPYHAIFLLDDTIPGPDASSDLQKIKEFCTPDRSIMDISNASGLATMQVFLIVRHLLLWARAIVIYPICRENFYSSCSHPQLPLQHYTEKFRCIFQEDLAVVLAQFSPSSTLDQFLDPSVYSEYDQMVRYNMLLYLLRYNLIVQLHTFIYLMEPFSDETMDRDAVSKLDDNEVRHLLEETTLSDALKCHVAEICGALLGIMPRDQVLISLNLFINMIPLLNGEHHVEDIMFRLNKGRLVIVKVLELFANVLCTFERPDFIHSQFT